MTQIPLGAALNLNGAVRQLDITQLNTLKFAPGGGVNAPVIPFSQLKNWQSSGDGWESWDTSATWGPGGFYPSLNCLTGNHEIEIYPNLDAIAALNIPLGAEGDLYYVDSDGAFTIQPHLLTTAEKAAVQGTMAALQASGNPQPQLANCEWMSGMVFSKPASLGLPFLIGARVKLPAMQTGLWPAVWLMNANGGWPPEMDILEAVQMAGQEVQFTSSMHSTDTATYPSGSETIAWKSVPQVDADYHDFWVVMYADYTTVFYDGVAVASLKTPADWQNAPAYLILNLAVAGEGNGWPGPLADNVTSLPPFKIRDVIAATMPAQYGTGTAAGYMPPSGAEPITIGSGSAPLPAPTPSPPAPASFVVTTAFGLPLKGKVTISGTAAAPWVNVAAFDMSGNKIAPDVTPDPTTGAWSTTLDTTVLPNGAFTFTVNAFSSPAGQAGGTSTGLPFTVAINNTPVVATPPTPPTPPPAPAPTPTPPAAPTLVSQAAAVKAAYAAAWAAAKPAAAAQPLQSKADAAMTALQAEIAAVVALVG